MYMNLKRCPEGAKKNHEVCLRSPDCKFWIGPEGLFRTCQLCLRSCSVHKNFTFFVFLVIGEGKTGPSQNDKNVPWIQTSTDIQKRPYLSQLATNLNSEGTFFSPTFKVRESKLPFLFWLSAIFGWDMIINKIQTSLIFTVSNHRLTSSTPYKRSYILACIFAKSLDHYSYKYWRCITQISPADLDRSKTRNILNMVFIWGFGCTLQRKFGHRFSPLYCLYIIYPIS